MNIKNDLKDVGLYLITPVRNKHNFKGIDYNRAHRNTVVGGLVLQLTMITVVFVGPVIVNEAIELKDRVLKRFKK